MIEGKAAQKESTSEEEDSRPSETRIKAELEATAGSIAEKTWEGVSEPAEQAEPLETPKPSRSKEATRVMLSQSATEKETVLGKR